MYVTIEYFVMYVGLGCTYINLFPYTLRNMFPVKNITKSHNLRHNLQCKRDYTFSDLKHINKILLFTYIYTHTGYSFNSSHNS